MLIFFIDEFLLQRFILNQLWITFDLWYNIDYFKLKKKNKYIQTWFVDIHSQKNIIRSIKYIEIYKQ